MLDDLRKPFFFVALLLIGLAVLLEMGSSLLMHAPGALGSDAPDGLGVSSLAVLDALVILTVALMGVALLVPERVQGRVQGIVTLVVAIVVLVCGVLLLMRAILMVSLMLGLLLAPVFGTLAYFAAFGSFDRAGAAAVLGLLTTLKLAFAICLLLAHQRFLENKGLVLLVASSLVAVLLVSFLHALVPMPLVSITDMVGAAIVAVIALVWSVVFIVGSVISIVKAVTLLPAVDRSVPQGRPDDS